MDHSRDVKSRGSIGKRRKERLIFRGETDKKEAGDNVAGLAIGLSSLDQCRELWTPFPDMNSVQAELPTFARLHVLWCSPHFTSLSDCSRAMLCFSKTLSCLH